jgi:hypothetical protein
MLCCPKGYHFINLKRKEKQVLNLIHLILKQVLFILGVRQPAEDRKFDTFNSQIILPSTHFPETAFVEEYQPFHVILSKTAIS